MHTSTVKITAMAQSSFRQVMTKCSRSARLKYRTSTSGQTPPRWKTTLKRTTFRESENFCETPLFWVMALKCRFQKSQDLLLDKQLWSQTSKWLSICASSLWTRLRSTLQTTRSSRRASVLSLIEIRSSRLEREQAVVAASFFWAMTTSSWLKQSAKASCSSCFKWCQV